MSEDLLRTVRKFLASGKGDSKRLHEIMNTIKDGTPLVMSDYRYVESLASQDIDIQSENAGITRLQGQQVRDESIEILRIRLAEGQITVDEFRELKKALADE